MSEEGSLRVEFDLTREDMLAFQRHFLRRHWLRAARFPFLLLVVALVFVWIVVTNRDTPDPSTAIAALSIAVACLCGVFASVAFSVFISPGLAVSRALRSEEDRARVLGPHAVCLSDFGMVSEFPGGHLSASWVVVTDVVEEPEALYLYVGPNPVAIVPRHAFEDPSALEDFAAAASRLSGVCEQQ